MTCFYRFACHSRFIMLLLLSIGASSESITIVAEDGQSSLYREVLERLATRHYRTQEINDEFSQQYLNEYINALDGGKNYFLQSDINEFSQWSSKLDDFAKQGNIEPGFIMFNRLKERAVAQLEINVKQLQDQSYKFNYESDESITYDGDLRDWFKSKESATLFWEKRLLDAMVRLLLNDKDEKEARELLIKRYKYQIKQFNQRESQDVFQLYVNALSSLYDPHTSYFSPRNNENFQINMSLSLEGIGAELTTDEDYTKVNRIIPGGPADTHGGLKAEDKIVGVGQAGDDIVDVVGWRIDDVVALIRGAKNTEVRLEFIPSKGDSSNTKTITIIRDRVKLEDKSAQSKIVEFELEGQDFKIGVIDIPAFYMDFEAYRARDPDYKSTTRDVYKLVKELNQKNIDGIVIDLRNNGGGSLYEATALTDLFIDYGPVVQIRDSEQRVNRSHRASRRAFYRGPLIVMVNRLSASASEIFAGALQDYGRALIVGSQSFGKGTVQDITPLTSGQLKLTISKFYRVSGDSTQHRGILPDIAFPSLHNIDEIGESLQDYALPWDKIRRVPHGSNNTLQKLIKPLTKSHLLRSLNDPDFVSLVEKINLSDSWAQETSLPLSIDKRRARTERWDNGLYTIENKRLVAKDSPPFETLEDWRQSSDENEDEDNDGIQIDESKSDIQTAGSSERESDTKVKDSQKIKDEDDDDENIQETDPMLFEAGRILADQITLQSAAISASL
jgi:carboxyl-terminal processing protease